MLEPMNSSDSEEDVDISDYVRIRLNISFYVWYDSKIRYIAAF